MGNTYSSDIVSPGFGGMGGFGGGFGCGGPMWLLLGLMFARGGFGGFGCGSGTGAISGEFNALNGAIDGSRAETIASVTSARSEQLAAVQSLTSTVQEGRVNAAESLGTLLQAIVGGNTNVKDKLLDTLGANASENRGLFTNVLDTLCNLKFQGAEQTNALMRDINGVSALATAQFNCLKTDVQALACGQKDILTAIQNLAPTIINHMTLTAKEAENAQLKAQVAKLEATVSQNTLISLLSGNTNLPVKA